MPESNKNSKSHLSDRSKQKGGRFREKPVRNPVEIVLIIFVLVFFVFVPRQGCGVSSDIDNEERAQRQAE